MKYVLIPLLILAVACVILAFFSLKEITSKQILTKEIEGNQIPLKEITSKQTLTKEIKGKQKVKFTVKNEPDHIHYDSSVGYYLLKRTDREVIDKRKVNVSESERYMDVQPGYKYNKLKS